MTVIRPCLFANKKSWQIGSLIMLELLHEAALWHAPEALDVASWRALSANVLEAGEDALLEELAGYVLGEGEGYRAQLMDVGLGNCD